jgi:hypothetical protein
MQSWVGSRSVVHRLAAVGLAAFLASACVAQVPDVRFKIDATLSFRSEKGGPALLKAYSALGRHSIVGLIFYTEPGFRVYVSQKLEKFSGEVDEQPLEEYYVEDEGIWRLGKQFLPFGTGNILRESVLAVRGDTNLILEHFPVSLAVCDGGSDAQHGVVARAGARVGVSAAFGNHFGIASTALDQIRDPEDSPGKGHGWRSAFGVDYTRKIDRLTIVAEGVALRNGETSTDADLTIADMSVTFAPVQGVTIQAGWTRLLPSDGDVYRVIGSFRITKMLSLEPVIRYRSERLFDAALELRIRF